MKLLVGAYWWTDDKWSDGHAKGFRYGPHHVRQLKDAVKRNLTVPHEFVCITDQPHAFDADKDIRPVVMDKATHVSGKEWAKWMTFHPDGPALFGGDRLLQLDLDGIICGNIDALVQRDESLVVWRNPCRVPWDRPETFQARALYNGSIILHTLGAAADLWHFFIDNKANVLTHMRDTQALMSIALGFDVPYWDAQDGIYRLARSDTPTSGLIGGEPLPDNARIVFFPGSEHKPWLPRVRKVFPWIADHWDEPEVMFGGQAGGGMEQWVSRR
jgi:hypothetical protein